MTAPNEQAPEMTEERARGILDAGRNGTPLKDLAWEVGRNPHGLGPHYLIGMANGYLARVEQEKARQGELVEGSVPYDSNGFVTRIHDLKTRLALMEAALVKADVQADLHKHPTRDYCPQCQARDEYRAARERTKGG